MSNEHNNAPAVPQGWKLVPLEPTPEIIEAICHAKNLTRNGLRAVMSDTELASIYRAMLAATPVPAPAPAQERCSTCGYLTSEREHLGCLRRAVKDLDIATGGPYDAQEVGLTDELIKKAAGTPEGYKFAAKGISKIDVWPHGGNWFPLYSLAQVQSIIAALRAKGGK